MISRKQFLKSTSGALALVAAAPLTPLLEGCAPSAYAVNAQVSDNKVVIPVANLPDLSRPNSYAKVYVSEHANPFLLFFQENGEAVAVLSTCTHRGCEVRKLRTKFECPCHGSEYDLRGNVLKGPAPEPLEQYNVLQFPDRLEFQIE